MRALPKSAVQLTNGAPARDYDAENRELDVAITSARQTFRAVENLYADPKDAIEFPYAGVHRFVGRVAPGRLVFVMANTGQGKTTFMLDAFDRWAEAGYRMDFLGTEQEPDELRTKWSCLRVGVPPGIAVNREWNEVSNGEAMRERVVEDLAKLDDAYGMEVLFAPDKFINLEKVESAAQTAYERGSKILIIDHIDRVETGASDSEYMALKRLIRRLKELARDCRLVMVAASQLNRKGREGDRLAAYRPPQLQHMQGGGMKEHEADLVLGLWRPIRQKGSLEGVKEYRNLIAAVREGAAPPSTILEPDTMAVVLLKHRTRGAMEGERCKLRLHHGRLSDVPRPYTTRSAGDEEER